MRTLSLLAMLVVLAAPALAEDDRVAELERKVDLLTREIEALSLGTVAETTRAVPRLGLAPAAAKVYGAPRGVSLGGYGEMLYENFDHLREDDTASGKLDRLDYLRQILYLGYKFTDELLFNSEIELEHGGVQDEAAVEGESDPLSGAVTGEAALSGEVVVEFAYLDWTLRRALGLRAGMLLVPVGLTNEIHEPPVFIGARRPEVEQRIIPTTWRANGLGLYGETTGGVSYRLYLTEGLNARGFSAAGGIRGGRQSGSRSLMTQAAVSARVDYAGLSGLLVGGSLYTGNAWQESQPTGFDLSPRLTLLDLHVRFQWRGLEARALYAHGTLGDADELSDARGLTGTDRLGESCFGAYVEAAYDVMPHLAAGSRLALSPYARYESYDTQDGVAGGTEDPANRREVITAGLAFKPHPNVVLKTDRQWRGNDAATETSQWNVALGYLF